MPGDRRSARCALAPLPRPGVDARLLGAFEGLADVGGVEAGLGPLGVVGGEFEAEVTAVELPGDGQGRAAAGERVEHEVSGAGAGPDDPAEELFGHLAAVPAGPLLERA